MTRTNALLLAILWTTFVAFNTILAGLLTNWFRYGPSLEVTFVFTAQALGIVLVAGVAAAQRVRRRTAVTPHVVAVGLAILLVLSAMKESHGTYIPRWQWNDVVQSPEQNLYLRNGATLRYRIELRNPFAARSSVLLVIVDDRRERRIRLPWNERVAAFVSSTDEEPWGALSTIPSRPSAVLLETTIEPGRPRSFRIDLDTGEAVEVSARARRSADD